MAAMRRRGLLVKSWPSPGLAGEHHGRQVVGAEVLPDEPRGSGLHARRSRNVGVQIVEDDQVDSPLDVIVGLHVGLDRRRGEQRSFGPFDRNVDEGERRDVLTLAVLEQLEVVLREVRDRGALPVGDDGIDFDVVDLHPEGHRGLISGRLGSCLLLLRRRLLAGNWLLLCDQQTTAEGRKSQGERKSLCHKSMSGLAIQIIGP